MAETVVKILLEMLANAILVVSVMFIIGAIMFSASEPFWEKYVDAIIPEEVSDEDLT